MVGVVSVVLSIATGLVVVKLGSFQHQLKAALIVLAMLTVAISALRPRAGLLVLLALCPFELAFYGTNSNEVLLFALAAVLALRIRLAAIPVWMLGGTLALVGGSFLASVGSHSPAPALEGALHWGAASILLLVATTVLATRKDASRIASTVITVTAVIVAGFGFMQRAGVDAIVGAPFNAGLPNSFFAYYTVYAGFLALAGTLTTGEIVIALEGRRYLRASLLGGALVVMVAALAESTARGGIVALAAGWLLLLVLNRRRGSVLGRVIIVLAVLSAVGYAVIPHSTILTLEHRFATSTGSLGEDQTRFAVQSAGLRALKESPFGLGYGNFSHYVKSDVHNGHIQIAFFHAHETFIQIGLDAGWIGLGGFLLLIGAALLSVVRHSRGGPSSVRATAFAAALVGFLAQGLYDYLFYDLAFIILFMVLIWGITHALAADSSPSSPAPENRAHRRRTASPPRQGYRPSRM
jgi:O-antigen ligase